MKKIIIRETIEDPIMTNARVMCPGYQRTSMNGAIVKWLQKLHLRRSATNICMFFHTTIHIFVEMANL